VRRGLRATFHAPTIDVVLLTHAHLDHCGRLPLLAKRGFRGRATRELARLVVLDAAHLQEEDAEHHARVGRQGADQASAQPLYTVADARNCLDKFKRTAGYDQPLELFPGVGATFVDAGHILGSASIVLDRAEAGRQLKLIFSGDLGNAGRPLLRGPATPPKADVAVIETTYGDRLHKPLGPSIEEFYGAITDTFRRGGNVVIPTFALERAQELLSVLHHGIETGRLANTIQVFLDSPMAISATEVFKRFPESLDDQTAKLIAAGGDPLALPGLHLTRRRLRYRLRSLRHYDSPGSVPRNKSCRMSEPFIFTISHHLGKEEAARRLRKGFADLPASFTPLFRINDQRWSGDHFDFSLSAFAQLITGTIEVADDHVRVELTLPRLLARLASQIPGVIQRETRLMLEKK